MWMYYSVKMHDTSPKNLLNNPGRENSRCIDHYSLCSPAGCGLTAAAHLFWSFFTLSFVIRPNEQFPSDRFCIFPSSQQQQQQIDKFKKYVIDFPRGIYLRSFRPSHGASPEIIHRVCPSCDLDEERSDWQVPDQIRREEGGEHQLPSASTSHRLTQLTDTAPLFRHSTVYNECRKV